MRLSCDKYYSRSGGNCNYYGRYNSSRYCIYLGLGTNLGILENNLLRAVYLIKKEIQGIGAVKASAVYLSSPVGIKEQPDFLNCVIAFEIIGVNKNFRRIYKDFGRRLLFKLKSIEKKMGRKKEAVRYSERVIDIDILYIYDECRGRAVKLDLHELKVPHSEIKNRKFVLIPLLNLQGNSNNLKEQLKILNENDAVCPQKIALYGQFNKNFTKVFKTHANGRLVSPRKKLYGEALRCK